MSEHRRRKKEKKFKGMRRPKCLGSKIESAYPKPRAFPGRAIGVLLAIVAVLDIRLHTAVGLPGLAQYCAVEGQSESPLQFVQTYADLASDVPPFKQDCRPGQSPFRLHWPGKHEYCHAGFLPRVALVANIQWVATVVYEGVARCTYFASARAWGIPKEKRTDRAKNPVVTVVAAYCFPVRSGGDHKKGEKANNQRS
ncbi:hypothetical protein B0H13DRAFT_1907324 [Mycena leptocephala]|nr:hypothetical protein B0H13DRAFT_1907324 [Mycena leptocephala]